MLRTILRSRRVEQQRLTAPPHPTGKVPMSRPVLLAVAPVLLALGLRAEEKGGVPADFDRLVRQLGSDSFRAREEATRRLSAGGEESLGPLRKAQAEADDPEQC